ncbi:hypothetical protein [Actinomadura craniellae]|uniref:hypothetical protein n=1 Tax=Actinomadura craniellae TaxID=2231787 RepID=UPI001313DFDE|nr:hypothetical protein [Actinomadura craniellae]
MVGQPRVNPAPARGRVDRGVAPGRAGGDVRRVGDAAGGDPRAGSRLRLRETYSDARSRHSARHGRIEKVRLRYVWVTLHLGIALTGLSLSLAILLG